MGVKFVTRIREDLGLTKYALAKQLGLMPPQVDHMERPEADRIRLSVLVKLRDISGLTWGELGEILEEEFRA